MKGGNPDKNRFSAFPLTLQFRHFPAKRQIEKIIMVFCSRNGAQKNPPGEGGLDEGKLKRKPFTDS